MAPVKRVKDRESERPPPRRRYVQFERSAELLACGDPRTFDEHEILFTACGTRVCDLHPTFVHMCRIRKHRNPGHIPDP